MLPSKLEQDSAIRRVAHVFNNEWPIFSEEYDEYEEGYNFLMGEQYTAEQKSWFKSQRRPTNVWNLIFPVFNRILGDFLLSFQRERVFAKSGGTVEVAALMEKMIETISINTRYKDEMAMTILAGLVKRGFIYPRFSNEIDLDGSVVIRNVDEFELMFDSRSLDPLLDDAQYLLRSKWWTVDQILAMYPQHRSKLARIMKDREDSAYFEAADEITRAMLGHKNFHDELNGKYRVIEFHDRVFETRDVAFDTVKQQSEILTVEGKRRDLYLKSNQNLRVVERPNQEIIKIDCVIPALDFFLERKDADVQDRCFDYIPLSPYVYGKKALNSFGVFKNAVGPQRSFNDMKNQVHNIVNKAANAATLIKPAGITNYRQLKNHLNEPGIEVQVKDEYRFEDVFKREDPISPPSAEMALSEDAYGLLNRIIGLTENMRGETQTTQENASLFYQRVKEAQKAFIPVDRSIKRVTERVWNRTIKLIQANYTREHVFLHVDLHKKSTERMVLNQQLGDVVLNDVTLGEYQIYPVQQEMNPTMRAFKFLQKTELVQSVYEMLGPTAINFRWWLENSDFEDIEELITMIEQAQGVQVQQMGVQAGMQEAAGIMQLAGQKLGLEQQADQSIGQMPMGKEQGGPPAVGGGQRQGPSNK